MRIGTSYKQHPGLKDEWDAIVIGSGMGGMAAAAALSHVGHKVLLLEQHQTLGGLDLPGAAPRWPRPQGNGDQG